ncbi:MAG: J domain-containing protein [Thermomicrobiales bacterium]
MAADPHTQEQDTATTGIGHDPDADDHYTLLGVPYAASHAEITAAYRRLMKRMHPDRQRPEARAAAEEMARRLNAAYAVLSDPVKRLAYDRTIQQQVIQDQIMRQYVGGFQSFDQGSRATHVHAQRQPTEAERRERAQANRRASLTLFFVAVVVTGVLIAAIVFGSFLASLFATLR